MFYTINISLHFSLTKVNWRQILELSGFLWKYRMVADWLAQDRARNQKNKRVDSENPPNKPGSPDPSLCSKRGQLESVPLSLFLPNNSQKDIR